MQGRGGMKGGKAIQILVSLAESQSSFETRVIKSHTAVVVCLIAVVPLTLSFFRLSYPLHAIVFCSSLGSLGELEANSQRRRRSGHMIKTIAAIHKNRSKQAAYFSPPRSSRMCMMMEETTFNNGRVRSHCFERRRKGRQHCYCHPPRMNLTASPLFARQVAKRDNDLPKA